MSDFLSALADSGSTLLGDLSGSQSSNFPANNANTPAPSGTNTPGSYSAAAPSGAAAAPPQTFTMPIWGWIAIAAVFVVLMIVLFARR